MTKYFLHFCMLLSIGSEAQIQQNINKPSGVVSNPISEIDSIRFNAAGDEMQVVLQNGQVELHQIIEIDSVFFEEALACGATPHSCGAACVHNPNLQYGTITDQDGNVYKTIIIGTQEWMAENLRTSTYQNGDSIQFCGNSSLWQSLTTGAWSYYGNGIENGCPYGKLYNWYAAADPRNACPVGWHLPSNAEWTLLTDHLGGTGIAGAKMKSIETQYWLSPNQAATNESGFSALPSGYRLFDGAFFSIADYCYWWSLNQTNSFDASDRFVNSTTGFVGEGNINKKCGFAVRCVKD